MSSRFDGYNDGYDDYWMLSAGRWEHNVRTALGGKRGQAALAELESALLALPQKVLVAGALCKGLNVCAVGALGVHRMQQRGVSYAGAIGKLRHYEDDYHAASHTAQYGTALGLTYTLAWTIAEANDEDFKHMTPEQRYDAMLGWVRKQLHR